MMIDRDTVVTSEDWRLCSQRLYEEAELLDRMEYRTWLTVVGAEIDYRVLNRLTRERASGASPFDQESYLVRCNRASLETRVARVETGWAFSEDPPATTRRFISNIRPQAVSSAKFSVKSSMLMFRARFEEQSFLSALRDDEWELDSTSCLRLTRRWIYLDHTVIPVENFSVAL
jgi:ethylbenzene dioxygenase beta subunit